jgi:hypothetical protein
MLGKLRSAESSVKYTICCLFKLILRMRAIGKAGTLAVVPCYQ